MNNMVNEILSVSDGQGKSLLKQLSRRKTIQQRMNVPNMRVCEKLHEYDIRSAGVLWRRTRWIENVVNELHSVVTGATESNDFELERKSASYPIISSRQPSNRSIVLNRSAQLHRTLVVFLPPSTAVGAGVSVNYSIVIK